MGGEQRHVSDSAMMKSRLHFEILLIENLTKLLWESQSPTIAGCSYDSFEPGGCLDTLRTICITVEWTYFELGMYVPFVKKIMKTGKRHKVCLHFDRCIDHVVSLTMEM